MTLRSRGSGVVACVLFAWLVVCRVLAPDCRAQEQKAVDLSQEAYGRDGDPLPPGAVVRVSESDFFHPEKVWWAGFSPDGATLLSVTEETLFRWTVPEGKLLSQAKVKAIARHWDVPVQVSPDGQMLATVDRKVYDVHLWKLQMGELQHTLGGLKGRLLGFSPDSKLLLTRFPSRGTVHVWDAASGNKLREWDAQDRQFWRVWASQILPDNKTLLTVNHDLVVRRWDYTKGQLLGEKTLERRSEVSAAEFSPGGEWLAVAGPMHKGGDIYNVRTGERAFELRDQYGGWMQIAGFLPDGKTLVTWSNPKRFALWDVTTGKEKSAFLADVDDAFLSPDGRWLAVRPDRYEWGREIQIWDPQAGRQLSTPRMRTYLRPVVSRLAMGDPMQVAIHWADGWGPIPAVGRYAGEYSQSATLASMSVRVITPAGVEHHLHPDVTQQDAKVPVRLQSRFYELPSFFLELRRDGFKTLVSGHSGSWREADAPSFSEVGEYRLSISGSIVINDQDPIPFQSGEVAIERVAKGVLPLEEIRKRAVAKLQAELGSQGNTMLLSDKGDYGDYEPIHVVGLPTHERVVLLATRQPSSIAGGELIDRYRVVVRPDGEVVDISHVQVGTCLAAGTHVETEHGPRPIEELEPGDRIWSFDLERDRPLLTTVQAVRRGEASAVLEITDGLAATAEHPIYANGGWAPAGRLRGGDILLGKDEPRALTADPRRIDRKTAVFDLTVDEPHNFFAGGLLVHNKSVGLNRGFYDRWKIFHFIAFPYANEVSRAGDD